MLRHSGMQRQSGRYGVSVVGDSPAPALLVAHWTCRMGQQCLCGETGSADLSCEIMDNPFYGVNSFDNVFWAFITIFQSITLEGWVDVMAHASRTARGTSRGRS